MPIRSLFTRVRLFLTLSLVVFIFSCSDAYFDFNFKGLDSENATDEDVSQCETLYSTPSDCLEVEEACDGKLEILTTSITEVIGCTPPGLSLGFLEMGTSAVASNIDLYAWVYPEANSSFAFENQSSLFIFSDQCGLMPLGGKKTCDYNPWLIVPALSNDSHFYIHVQTNIEKDVQVGYQLQSRDKWIHLLPPADSPIICASAPSGILEDLDNPNPLMGVDVSLDFSVSAPALEGDPWICGENAQGWRQAAFMIRNHFDTDITIVGINVYPTGTSADTQVPFHYSLYSCAINDALTSDTIPLAQSCQGDGPLPTISVLSKNWSSPLDPEPITVLILQIPPSVNPKLELSFDLMPM